MTQPPAWDEMPPWEQRLRARRVALPDWADEAPERCAVVATTEEGVVETHSWSPGGQPVQMTRRPDGTPDATIDPNGAWVWWFDDTSGDEYGVWRRQPFGAGPGQDVEDPTGLPAAYSAGLDLGRSGLVVVGSNDDDYGTRIHVLVPGAGSPRLLYAHRETAYVGGLARDESLLAISHSEHGDSRHPALRVVRTADGGTVGELWDGPGRSLRPAGFAPVAGDQRLLVIHERAGVPGLLLWDPVDDPAGSAVRELPVAAPGEVTDVDWFPDRRRAPGRARPRGSDPALAARPGRRHHDAGRPAVRHGLGRRRAPRRRRLARLVVGVHAARDPLRLRARSCSSRWVRAAPGSVAVQDIWAEGPGGAVHALLRLPATGTAPYPTVFEIHGGPEWHDADAFAGYASAYVDQGYAVVNVNYRGSTGYGTAWRDAIGARIGHTELADVRAVREHLVQAGVCDPERVALSGSSWGGYLTLLGLGSQPDAWTVGVASVPVADYLAAYEDEMEALKAFDRALFGGAPDEVRDRYVDSSPITYVESVRAPAPRARRRERPPLPHPPGRQLPGPADRARHARTRSTASTPATAPWSTTSAWPSCASSSTSSPATWPRPPPPDPLSTSPSRTFRRSAPRRRRTVAPNPLCSAPH